ncbi:hypothetical protein B0H13DRAFT_2469056 [Mycena leptocephala]|nr:hypothetical protein B0H13DRAFT_2469056 [Mycena leptocephala]
MMRMPSIELVRSRVMEDPRSLQRSRNGTSSRSSPTSCMRSAALGRSARAPPVVPAPIDTGTRMGRSAPPRTLDIRPAESMPARNGGSKGPHRRHPARKLPFPPSAPLLTRHRETARICRARKLSVGTRSPRSTNFAPDPFRVQENAPSPVSSSAMRDGATKALRVLHAESAVGSMCGGRGRQGEFGGGSKHVRRPAREQAEGAPAVAPAGTPSGAPQGVTES